MLESEEGEPGIVEECLNDTIATWNSRGTPAVGQPESLADDPLLREPLYSATFRGNIRNAERAIAEDRDRFSTMPEDERVTILPAVMDPAEFLAEATGLRDWEQSVVNGEDLKKALTTVTKQQHMFNEDLRRENAAVKDTREFTPVENESAQAAPAPGSSRPRYRLRAA